MQTINPFLDLLTQMSFQVGFLAPLTIAMVKGATTIGFPKKSAFILDILFGLVFAWLSASGAEPRQIVFTGVLIGLSAAGLYSGLLKPSLSKAPEETTGIVPEI